VFNGALLAGGGFTMAGRTTARHLARWGGTSWGEFGGGGDARGNVLSSFQNEIHAGGQFKQGGRSMLTFSGWAHPSCNIPGDFDGDGDVDGDDLNIFRLCAAGTGLPYAPTCTLPPDVNGHIAADFNQDGDADADDFGVFQRCYSGQNHPGNPNCAN